MKTDDLQKTGIELHKLLMSGNPTAFARIAELYLEPLKLALSRRFFNLPDPHAIDTAIEDALLSYWSQPDKYDPSKRNLIGYLYMSARGDLLNELARYKSEISQADFVELFGDEPEYFIEEESGTFDVEQVIAGRTSPIMERIRSLLTDPIDMEILLLMFLDVRETTEFAQVLQITELPFTQQQQIVKQNKDRIKKMIQRHISPKELTL